MKLSSFISGPGMAAHIPMDQQTKYQYSPNSSSICSFQERGETGCIYIILFINV